MNLFSELLNASYSVEAKKWVGINPDEPSLGVRTWFMITLKAPKAKPVHLLVHKYWNGDLNSALATLLHKHFPNSPLHRQWRKSEGLSIVKFEPHALEEFGELMHSGLRKLVNTPESAGTWLSLHSLCEEDRAVFFEAARDAAKAVFKKDKQPTRRDVASQVKETAELALKQRVYAYRLGLRSEQRDVIRTEKQALALQMLYIGVKASSLSEWMWGWLGFILKDTARRKPAKPKAKQPRAPRPVRAQKANARKARA